MKIFKSFIYLALLICILGQPFYAFSQQKKDSDYLVKLTYNQLSDSDLYFRIFPSAAIPKDSTYRNIPAGFELSGLRYFTIDLCQMMYERFLSGKMTKESWSDYLKQFKFKMPVVSNRPVKNNNIGVFSALDKEGNKTIIIDANNNKDFGDDRKYFTKKNYDTVFKVNFTGSYYNGNHITDTIFSVLMNPVQNILINNDTLRQKLGITIINNSIFSGQLNIGEYKYRFAFSKPLVPNRAATGPIIGQITDYDQRGHLLSSSTHQLNDTIGIVNKVYQISEVDFNRQILTLKYVGTGKNTGTEIGETVYDFKARDLINDKLISPGLFKGKYVLLDFWGSWCNPCIKAIPELAELYKNNQDKLHIISIAYDRRQDLNKLKSLITEKGLIWSNVWDEASKRELVNRFGITSFPTFILVDPNGKIVFKNDGKYTLTDLKKLIL
jgi:thiol-disulfide isomerase/thioredoxin